MNKINLSALLAVLFSILTVTAWGQATPSTEGRDFWVTFLQGNRNTSDKTTLTLTISALEACSVKIENPSANYTYTTYVGDNSSTDVTTDDRLIMANCYSTQSEQATYTALHVTATKDISLFAGNYRKASFDATNVLPTVALLDDYLIQTYPASDHEDKPQGSHFAIIAVEDGETVVDYNLTTATESGRTGAQSVTLKKGQVWYVWTGKNEGDASDLSGTTVKARGGKKIAVFQGCSHTNLPTLARDRDHLISQAMPTAYWGSEFAITSSLNHRRDIVAVMALNDGTEVYINDKDGDPQLVHTFDFSKDKKHYWTFEIGEEIAYCTDASAPASGKLPEPLVIDSSCYLTTSCPAGVHLFMVSNRYDEPTSTHNSAAINDPAMLWISPIEQVIKEINFSTYKTQQGKYHYMNILTLTSNINDMVWTDQNGTKNDISRYFHPLHGNPDYSYARIEIQHGSHNLKGEAGFLAHVYGYGERESYAYSCGSSTVQRSITFDGIPIMLDSVSSTPFCVGEEIQMKLNIGNNDYQSVEWDFGDGTTYSPPTNAPNNEKKTASHVYPAPGWYDLTVTAEYINSCTGQKYSDPLKVTFRVVQADTVFGNVSHDCIELDSTLNGKELTATEIEELISGGNKVPRDRAHCYDTVYIDYVHYGIKTDSTYTYIAQDSIYLNGAWRYTDEKVSWTIPNGNRYGCDSIVTCDLKVRACLQMNMQAESAACYGEPLRINYSKKGNFAPIEDESEFNARVVVTGQTDTLITIDNEFKEGTIELATGQLVKKPGKYTAVFTFRDTLCERTVEVPVDFTVYYPTDIFKYKFNNVLAVYNPGYGGNKKDRDIEDGDASNGWVFTAYQWFLNGEAIDSVANPTAVTPVYHTEAPFNEGDEYYVELTDQRGNKLRSCARTIDSVPPIEPKPAQAPAQKVIINNRMVIRLEGRDFNIYGQRVQ